jgi:hypothetical protein
MTRATLTRRLARRLARHAARLLAGTDASSWGRALQSEVEHIDRDRAALGWAMHGLTYAYTRRISSMRLGTLRPARPLLALEMLICFLPLTAVFAAAARVALASPDHLPSGLAALLAASALGPAGLLAALPASVRRHAAPGRAPALLLAALAVLTVVAWGAGVLPAPSWYDAVLCVLLPIAGAAHLSLLRPAAPVPAAAG